MTRLSNRALQELALDSAALLDRVCTDIAHGVLQRVAEAEGGLTASRADRSAIAGGAHADPTARLALRGVELASAHRDEVQRLLVHLRAQTDRLAQLVALYPTPHAAGEADRLALARLNARSEPGCQSCARIPGPRGGPRWEPAHPKLDGPTWAGGRLAEPMWLCRWCYEALLAWNRLPSEKELVRHHAGQRVPWPADVERPA